MTSNATSARDDHAVRAVLGDVYAPRVAGDANAFLADYWPSASPVLPGSWLQGKVAIRAAMTDAFAGPLKDSRVSVR